MSDWVAVTGPSRGIGRATCLALASRGVNVALVGRPSTSLQEVERAVSERGVQAAIVPVDLSDPAAVRSAGGKLLATTGAPRAIIHNAATIHRESVARLQDEHWREQLAVNLTAPAWLTRALLPAMQGKGEGRFIFVGSIASTVGTAQASAYCATKWGLVGFMKALAEELSGSELMALAVLPGSVDTRMLVGSGLEPRITPQQVAATLVHYALDAPLAHNGATIEMFAS